MKVFRIAIVPAALIALGTGTVAYGLHQPGVVGDHRAMSSPSAANTVITMSATGDIMMSNAPGNLPPENGAGFFDSVASSLKADLVMGNLEQPLTGDTGASKCGSPPTPNCFAFRSPPSYARHLHDAGFDLVNTANNHTLDYGPVGARNTRAALKSAGVLATGKLDEITVTQVKGVRIAVVGFAPYAGLNNLNDLRHSREIVLSAKRQADLVVLQVHMGAEGMDRQHVRPGHEIFLGEDRGDPIAFSHAMIDAGADLIIGHSPHVLRGMQFYRGRLIAYSMGNFAGGGKALSSRGLLKYGGILRVSLEKDGTYVSGSFLSTQMNSIGLPIRDSANERGRQLVEQLSADDFGATRPRFGADGSIRPQI
ncbi:CapA family protein [Actinoplanes sp. TBRC 11911]|nr:CapA family protein [Actinoplanes sp. TBRC 11911]